MSLPHRVLFVEDCPLFKRSFARLLTREFGLAVTVAESGEEAIGQFGAMNPELVILDLGLPGVDGTETLQVIRALPGGETVPVVVLTGSNDVELKRAAAQLDIEGYVLKENARGEFPDLLQSIFPDLCAKAGGCIPSSGGSIPLDDSPDVCKTNSDVGGGYSVFDASCPHTPSKGSG